MFLSTSYFLNLFYLHKKSRTRKLNAMATGGSETNEDFSPLRHAIAREANRTTGMYDMQRTQRYMGDAMTCACTKIGCETSGMRGENNSAHCGYPDNANLTTHSCKLLWNAETDLATRTLGGSML